MKRRFPAVLTAVIALLLLLPLLFSCQKNEKPQDSESTPLPTINPSKFIYESDGESITITGYSGIEPTISIPAELDGLPVKTIAENAFREFTYLKKVYLPDSVETIDYAFVSCPDLTYVRLGKSITSMNGAFRGCSKLATVEGMVAPQYLDEAFYGCASLTEGRIPASAKSAVAAYANCSHLLTATVEEGITALERTFEGCISLSAIALPDSVTELVRTFAGCVSLTEATGGTEATLLDATFENCSLLSSFALGKDLTTMTGAFVGCSALSQLTGMPETLTVYTPSFTGCRSLTSLLIPAIEEESYREAYDPAADVRGCERLETVVILTEYVVREEFCKIFSGCHSLVSVTMTDTNAAATFRLSYTITDSIFEGTNKTLSSAVKKWKKASAARVTGQYGTVDGVSYTHIYGGDVDVFDLEKVLSKTDCLNFEPFERHYFWCGYPDGGNRKEETVGIQRTYTFLLRTTGKNDGTLPEILTINGLTCAVGE